VPGGLVGGALVIRVGWAGPVASTASRVRCVGRGNAAVMGSAGSGTLLGPEEMGRERNPAFPLCVGVGGGFVLSVPLGGTDRPSYRVAGCVDPGFSGVCVGCCGLVAGAVGWLFVVCELHSGREHLLWPSFLGHTVDALASGADEGRGRLRYASGSRQPDVDPGMSEWGNLASVMGCCRRLNV
jgi:hypothetical protein